MHAFAEVLRVKDCTIFDLLHQSFEERDFIFFTRLAAHLGKLMGCTDQDAVDFGKLSELLYLSSLLHVSLSEETETMDTLRAEKQMPVLLGDLLYGKFISWLADCGKVQCLPTYLTYLRQFNINGVDGLEGRKIVNLDTAVQLLTEKTAEAMANFTNFDKLVAIDEAKAYWSAQWDALKGEKVDTFVELEALLQREFGQGAKVC